MRSAPNPVQQLANALQTVIAADEVARQSAHLWRCHRNARDELLCTLPLGRRHGIAEGVQFTVVDAQEGHTLGRFRVTGTAETFAACTLTEGTGWLQVAERYGDAPLPPHELHFALPDAVRGMDARTADEMLQLLAALASNGRARPATTDDRDATGGATMSDTTAAELRAWLEIFAACVRAQDFDAARPMIAEEVVSFGTKAAMVEGRENLIAQQWRHIWPTIQGFTFDSRYAPLAPRGRYRVGRPHLDLARLPAGRHALPPPRPRHLHLRPSRRRMAGDAHALLALPTAIAPRNGTA